MSKSLFVSRIVLRVMCGLLGFIVVQDNSKQADFRARILVANYTSPMDRLAVELVFPCIMVMQAVAFQSWLFVFMIMLAFHALTLV